jgi:hydroxymethylbilane synthase
VFTEELEEQLAGGVVDIAVHSAKDMQSTLPEGFDLIAFTEREQSHDVLVGLGPVDLVDSSRPLTIGTSSVRRVALLNHFYPHVKTVPMRGNLQTRLAKLTDGVCDALVLAYAGVTRMGYDNLIVHSFAKDRFIPPVGQGCIAVEASADLAFEKKEMVRKYVNDRESELCLRAERAFLKTMEGGCSIPAFGHAVMDGDQIRLTAGLANLDGSRLLKKSVHGPADAPEALGTEAGNYILAHNGREMLASIRSELER